tara:strand:- start:435 stop:1163 length:729 start_codon:yes stop_codon:yes gene_type:complete
LNNKNANILLSDCELEKLAKNHFELQQAVIDDLGPNQTAVHERTLDEWKELLCSDHHQVISIYQDGDLVAHAVVVLPSKEFPDADMLDMNLPADFEQLTTLSSVMTHPGKQGKNIMNKIIKEWKRIAKQENRNHLLALITTNNVKSWSQFIKEGLAITGVGHDPSDNSECYFAHMDTNESLLEDFNKASLGPLLMSPDASLKDMKEVFALGYVGYKAEKDPVSNLYTGRLYMKKKKKALKAA